MLSLLRQYIIFSPGIKQLVLWDTEYQFLLKSVGAESSQNHKDLGIKYCGADLANQKGQSKAFPSSEQSEEISNLQLGQLLRCMRWIRKNISIWIKNVLLERDL